MLVLVTCVFLLGYLPFITVNVLALFDNQKYGFYGGRSTFRTEQGSENNVGGRTSPDVTSNFLSENSQSQNIPWETDLSVLSASISSSVWPSMPGPHGAKTRHERKGNELPSVSNLTYSQRLTFELCSRSHFLSSAANPLIYSVLNVRFRQESMVALRHVILRLPHWLRKRFKGQHGVT